LLLAAALVLRGAPARALELNPPIAPPPPDGQVMGTKEDRILWFFPNYRTVDQEKSHPVITPRDKLAIALNDSFDPYAFPVPLLFAGVSQLQDSPTSWGRGNDGFKKRYFASLADQTVSNMMAEGLFPIMLHQDPRYLRLGRGGFWHRTWYAVTRVVVTRTDSGGAEFNYSEFGGNAVMVTASNLYYPAENRTVRSNAEKLGIQIGIDMLGGIGKEFWPDVKAWLTGKRATNPP
jgi:hypothetical protein